ncbi:MAG: glutamate-1-semialdehyde 2,1-aminomutase [Gammaproteobacteria bacterium]|nr:glutamate-1-semialdehyde 2,1-aminomutase [Gammaproteobacteria bacterium]
MMDQNLTLMQEACKVLPGGVNSPVRSFQAVGGNPIFINRAQGAYIWDANNTPYIDYIGSWGAMLAGHAHPKVVTAVKQAIDLGFSYGTPTERETLLAQKVLRHFPSIDLIRLVNSGTEAVMSALRLARGYTKRALIVKFEGCYHGHTDALLIKGGSGLATFGAPNSAGVSMDTIKDTIVLEYNNIPQLEETFAQRGQNIACVILEPIAGNMNFVRAHSEFIEVCQKLCTEFQSLLIFDEVMTGFRVAMGGAQEIYQQKIPSLKPDLTLLGKVIGGGMPLAAFGGKKSIMQHLAPLGAVYQAGTLSGNPIATACGLATLEILEQPGVYAHLANLSKKLTEGLCQLGKIKGLPVQVDYEGGMFGFFLLDALPTTYQEVAHSNSKIFSKLFHSLLKQGIYIAPSMYECGFISIQHSESDLDKTLAAFETTFNLL